MREPMVSAWNLPNLLEAPVDDPSALFSAIAIETLQRSVLVVADREHRIHEIEFYLHSDAHADPYSHRSEHQRTPARWYFHRQGQGYRAGSFKGLDFTFGPPSTHGGILIRSISPRDDPTSLISGPSLCVDHILRATGQPRAETLDRLLGGRRVFDPGPLALRAAAELSTDRLWATARVGLGLNRCATFPTMPSFVARPYRFLDRPRDIPKGRVHLVVAMRERGLTVDEIARLTGGKSIAPWLNAFERGRARTGPPPEGGSVDACAVAYRLGYFGAVATCEPSPRV